MVFTTAVFLFMFLPITLFLYYMAKDKYKNIILFVASMIFYSWGGAKYLILILVLIIINYFSGLLMEKYKEDKRTKKYYLGLTIFINIIVLIYFKYFGFIMENIIELLNFIKIPISEPKFNITLPIGISFFTFQILSYIIDLYNGKIKVQKNFINFGLYVMLFPQLIAGPIVRYIDIEEQINSRKVTVDKFYYGIQRFIVGFAKKMLLSNMTGYVANNIFNYNFNFDNMLFYWMGAICYGLQIYFDFSGYSDMAIGLGKMFGFDFLENFNYPYISKSIKEFWRRWHISLSTWFKDYLYIPLGGNREGKLKTYRNLLIVFFVTGFWHGASWNFIIWGLYFGAFLILERGKFGEWLKKIPVLFQRIYALIIILIGWVFFRTETISEAITYIKGMFSFKLEKINLIYSFIDKEHLIFIVFALIFATPILKYIRNKVRSKFESKKKVIDVIEFLILILVFYISILYMTGSSYNPFIYFRF